MGLKNNGNSARRSGRRAKLHPCYGTKQRERQNFIWLV